MNLKEWALKYAEMGWAVFPIKPPSAGGRSPGKEPATPNGFKDATTDRMKIETWWTACPD